MLAGPIADEAADKEDGSETPYRIKYEADCIVFLVARGKEQLDQGNAPFLASFRPTISTKSRANQLHETLHGRGRLRLIHFFHYSLTILTFV
jgi:hypothetical protein